MAAKAPSSSDTEARVPTPYFYNDARCSGALPVPVPVVGAWGTVGVADVVIVPLSGLLSEKNDMMLARGAAAADSGNVGGTDSFAPLLLQ